MPFEQRMPSAEGRSQQGRSESRSETMQRRREAIRQTGASLREAEDALRQLGGLSESPQLQAEGLALELEGEALSQELNPSEKVGRKVAIEEDEKVDYRGPEKKVLNQLKVIRNAFKQGELQEEQFGIILEEISRKSIKDAMELAMETDFDHEKMLGILGRTAALMHPEDPEFQQDRILEGLRYRSKFTTPLLEAFRSAVKPSSFDAQEKTKILGKKGEELLANMNGAYAEFAKWSGKKGRKSADEIEEFYLGQLMTTEEFEAYQHVKDIERVVAGVIEPKKMKQIVEKLPIPKEILEELEQAEKKKRGSGSFDEEDVKKTFAYAMTFVEALPLYKEKQKREAQNAPYDHEFTLAWNRQAESIDDAFKALIGAYENKETSTKQAAALLSLLQVPSEVAEDVIHRKREKLEALSPLMFEADVKRLEKVKEILEKKKKNVRSFKDTIQSRIDDISALQKTLREGAPFTPTRSSGYQVGFTEIEGRFKGRQEKEQRKINIPFGFNEGLEKENPAFPGFTYVAKNDVYTDRQYEKFMDYLVPEWSLSRRDGHGPDDKEGGRREEREREYQEAQKQVEELYYQPRDEEENIDGDPTEKGRTKLMELSRPVNLMMMHGVFDVYDKESHVWKMRQGLPEAKRQRQTVPVICKIPAPVGSLRIPAPLYGTVSQERIVGVGKDGQPIPVAAKLDEKGFIQIEVTKDSGVKELIYEVQIPEDESDIPDISDKEYKAWAKEHLTKEEKEGAQELLKSLSPECVQFLKTIEGKTPRERVQEIEKFVRNIGFYDFKNKETFGLKRQVSLSRRLEVMRARMEELREAHPEQLDKKIFAGVCADFQELTTAMMQASGLVAGRLAGLRISGEEATVANCHAASYVEFPPIDGERQVIPVDGTPTAAILPEEKRKLIQMREATTRRSAQEKTDTQGSKDAVDEEEYEGLGEEASPVVEPQQEEEVKQRTFGEEIDEVLTEDEKWQLQALRDVLMYAPLKSMGSAWLKDPSNQEQISQLIQSALQEKSSAVKAAKGDDLERMWKNLRVDWSVPNRAVTAEDLQRILAEASGKLSEKQRRILNRLGA